MKRKILSLILVLMLLPVASVFVACNKDKGYNLNNLSKDYEKIELENNNIAMIDDLILIDYSAYDNLNNSVNAVEPYTALKSYNYVLNNVLKFTCNYIEICSNNELQVPATVKNNVKSSLDTFKKSVKDVDVCVDSLGEIISVSDDVLDRSCISRYKNLLNTYETMLNRAIDFNNAYYNYVQKQGWDSSCMYATYRNWLGVRNGEIWLITGKTKTNNYIYGMEFWKKVKDEQFDDIICIDGGGSYYWKNGKTVKTTSGSRRINTIITI